LADYFWRFSNSFCGPQIEPAFSFVLISNLPADLSEAIRSVSHLVLAPLWANAFSLNFEPKGAAPDSSWFRLLPARFF
jgi:hypothetical protein